MWVRLDDSMHSHPKARAAGLEAMGLWALSASWVGQYGTDGWVPEWFVSTLPRGKSVARSLVSAGLWEPSVRDAEKGWQFHDWTAYNPSNAQVRAEKEAAAERKRRWKERQQNGDEHA